MRPILIATADADAAQVIARALQDEHTPEFAADLESALRLAQKRRHEFVFIDCALLAEKGVDGPMRYRLALQSFRQAFPTLHIIVLASSARIRDAVNAVKAGASNYLTWPVDPEELLFVTRALTDSFRMQSELDYLRGEFWQPDIVDFVRTHNPKMQDVYLKVRLVAPTISTVLLTGETGTGKGVIARLIHRHSNRASAPFVSVHCGAIPETLLESELFGHEKGAFTGADRRKLGKVEIAQGGTLFLDEIGTLSHAVQVKLLQILQEKRFQRVGGESDHQADVRIISATNENLARLAEQGRFRRDLYYRLNVFPIELPPLRDRLEDIPLLVAAFLRRLNNEYGKHISDIHPTVLQGFMTYPWPGNIREMENLVERAYILETSSVLSPTGFPTEMFGRSTEATTIQPDPMLSLAEVRQKAIELAENAYLKRVLAENEGRIDRTAKAAGIGVRQLHKLLTKYGLRKEDYRRPTRP